MHLRACTHTQNLLYPFQSSGDWLDARILCTHTSNILTNVSMGFKCEWISWWLCDDVCVLGVLVCVCRMCVHLCMISWLITDTWPLPLTSACRGGLQVIRARGLNYIYLSAAYDSVQLAPPTTPSDSHIRAAHAHRSTQTNTNMFITEEIKAFTKLPPYQAKSKPTNNL